MAKTNAELLQMAKEGDLNGLMALADFDADSGQDGVVYKWLCVAADFGHENADELISDLLETSSLRYDDDQFHSGAAHFELAVSYLCGEEGFAVDFEKGERHLVEASERQYPASVHQSGQLIEAARARLSGEALKRFNSHVNQ